MKRLCVLVAIGLFGQFYGPEAKAQTLQGQLQSEVVLRDGRITDTATGLQFRKVCGIAGTKDIIEFNNGSQHLRMSPNGKFLLYNNYVIPLEDGELINLVPALRSVWSPDGKKIAFYSDGIWVIPVSPETGRPTGPAKELLDGGYMFQWYARWSPDSDKIVFWSTDQHLSVLSIHDGKVIQLTKSAQYYVQGGWSPDGKWIVFNQNRDSMWVIPSDSEDGEARKLAETAGRAMAHWSPDGKWVFYQMDRKLHFIRVSDALTFNITLPQEVGYYVSWSQDDKKMLFYKCSYEYMNTLSIVPSSGGEPFGPRGFNLSWGQHWTADSKFVLTWGKHDDKGTYWIVPLTGDNAFPLRLDASMQGVLEQESLSPDARKLLFSQRTPYTEKQYWVAPILPRQGKTVGLPTKIFDRGEVKRFDWSPDGSKLVFLYQEELWMARTDGSPPVQLVETSDSRIVRFAWSPDGSAIVWISHSPSSGKSILQMRRLSEDESRVITESPTYISFKWSPYGRHIAYEFYERKKDTNRELYVVPALGGESKRLIQGSIDRWAWSPTGDHLAVLADQKLLILHVPDGEYYQLGKLLDPNWNECNDMKWSPDGQEITLIMLPKLNSSTEEITSLFTVSVPEGTWTELTGRLGTSYSHSWSPDGKWIAYDLEDFIKTRPEGILWEVEVETYLRKMDEKLPRSSSSSKD